VSKKYAPDGQYIPRTYFLSPTGTLDPSIHEARDRYMYFWQRAGASRVAGRHEQGTAEAALRKRTLKGAATMKQIDALESGSRRL